MFKHKKITLANKMPLISLPVSGARTATVLVMAKTGSKYEKRKESGLSHFLEHMFFKGTEKRPDTLSLSAELDALGAEFNAFTSKEYTGYYVKVPKGKLKQAIDVLSDMLLNSKFDSQEIEREKGVIIEELNMYADNPMMHLEDVLESCLYGDTPAGWDTIGTKETINSFKRSDFLRYFRSQYGAKSLSVILSGAISPVEEKLAASAFSAFSDNSWKDKVKVKEKQTKPQLKIAQKKTDQVNMAVALRTFPVGHPQELALKLLATVLGGSMSSRLFISLRERSGLAYYVRTSTELYSDSGYLSTQAGVPKGKAKDALKIILAEYKKVLDEEIPKEELQRAKDLLAGKIMMQLEASDELASWYGRQAVLRSQFISPERMIKGLQALSAKDLSKVAKLVMKEKSLNLAIIGDIKASEKQSLSKLLHL